VTLRYITAIETELRRTPLAKVQKEMAAERMGVALAKFSASHAAVRWDEALVDLATALEAVIMPGRQAEDVTFRLRVRAAQLLASANDPSDQIYQDVATLYRIRSKLVHGDDLALKTLMKDARSAGGTTEQDWNSLQVWGAVDRLRDLVRRAIVARIILNYLGLWTDKSDLDEVLANTGLHPWAKQWQRHLSRKKCGPVALRPTELVDTLKLTEKYR